MNNFDYSLLPMNEHSNIRSTESDYQIWPSSVERLPKMGVESRILASAECVKKLAST